MNTPGYEQLAAVLQDAFRQAAAGKGAERHANGLPFHEQRMQTISALLDSDAGMAFQVCKKLTEGMRLPHEARERELLGAINYIAGMVIFHRQRQPKAETPAELLTTEEREVLKNLAMKGVREPIGLDVSFDQTGRQQVVEQNGNTGEHYGSKVVDLPNTDALVDPTGKPKWGDAPIWANYLTQDAAGVWTFWQREPRPFAKRWICDDAGLRAEVNSGKVSGNWRETLEPAPGLLNTEKKA